MAYVGVQRKNGHTVSVSVSEKKLRINDEVFDIPEHIFKNSSSVSQINGEIFINGFEFDQKKKKFKRSLRALYYLFF